MRRFIFLLDDESANLLEGKRNKAEFVRQAIKLYHYDIKPDTVVGLRKAYIEINSKLDYIAHKLQ